MGSVYHMAILTVRHLPLHLSHNHSFTLISFSSILAKASDRIVKPFHHWPDRCPPWDRWSYLSNGSQGHDQVRVDRVYVALAKRDQRLLGLVRGPHPRACEAWVPSHVLAWPSRYGISVPEPKIWIRHRSWPIGLWFIGVMLDFY